MVQHVFEKACGSNDHRNTNPKRWLSDEMSAIGKELSGLLRNIMKAFEERNLESATTLMGQLKRLQDREGASRDSCLKILASRNGNTDDLRWTSRAHKILSLMEKSSDEIEKIAHKVTDIDRSYTLPFFKDLPEMGRMACGMLDRSIHAVLQPEQERARQIIEEDSFLDRSRDEFLEKARVFLRKHPEDAKNLTPFMLISKHLERIGDHASHIAEEIIYFLNGNGTSP